MTGGDKVYIKVSAITAVQSYRGVCQMLLACFCVRFFETPTCSSLRSHCLLAATDGGRVGESVTLFKQQLWSTERLKTNTHLRYLMRHTK